MSVRVAVTGGRDHSDRAAVFAALDLLHARRTISAIMHGACAGRDGVLRGADRWADEWAIANGFEPIRFPADWNRFDRAAGPIRNEQILAEGRPDVVVAFRGGDGTAGMCLLAYRAGVPVIGAVRRNDGTIGFDRLKLDTPAAADRAGSGYPRGRERVGE